MAYGSLSLTGGRPIEEGLGTDDLTYSHKKPKPATDGALGGVITALVGKKASPWMAGASLIGDAISSIMESDRAKDENTIEALNDLRASRDWVDW